jgi:hypothetical protein
MGGNMPSKSKRDVPTIDARAVPAAIGKDYKLVNTPKVRRGSTPDSRG